MFESPVRRLLQAPNHQSGRPAKKRKAIPRFRPQCESLEPRWVPTLSLTTLASFTASNGADPVASLARDASGNFFGAANGTLPAYQATLFELAKGSSSITTLATFAGNPGPHPFSDLILDKDGNLFGTTTSGGANGKGAIFELAKGTSSITTLASFDGTNGLSPRGHLVMDGNGNLYGTAQRGGSADMGTIFELAKGSNSLTALASFDFNSGTVPYGGLLMDADGNFFGTTSSGGSLANAGTVFELGHGGSSITPLAAFSGANGSFAVGSLVLDVTGNLFGTTEFGGSSSAGTVFEVVKGSGAITKLADFNYANGANPQAGLVLDSDGNLFGTASAGGSAGKGTVFEVAKGSGTITVLATFTGSNGSAPYASLIADAQGNFYGTTSAGGTSNKGTIFQLGQKPTAPVITSSPAKSFLAGQANSFTLAATGSPSPALSRTGTLPAGVTFDSATGLLSGTPAKGSGGVYHLVFMAMNGVAPNATQPFTLTVNESPTITSADSKTLTTGSTLAFKVTASGFPKPVLGETGALPKGVIWVPASGMLSGVPVAGTGGVYALTFSASNGVGAKATQSFTLTVNQPPSISSVAVRTFTVGAAGTFTVIAKGFPAPKFSETGALPVGVTLDQNTGLLQGTPAANTGGTYKIKIMASNGIGIAAAQNFTLTVNQAPAITSADNVSFMVGILGQFKVKASGFPAPTFTISGKLPVGVTFNAITGVLSGKAAKGTAGQYKVTLTAKNVAGLSIAQLFTLTVS